MQVRVLAPYSVSNALCVCAWFHYANNYMGARRFCDLLALAAQELTKPGAKLAAVVVNIDEMSGNKAVITLSEWKQTPWKRAGA